MKYTFHQKNNLIAERSCNKIYSKLKNQINQMECTYATQSGHNKPLLGGHLTVEGLKLVCISSQCFTAVLYQL